MENNKRPREEILAEIFSIEEKVNEATVKFNNHEIVIGLQEFHNMLYIYRNKLPDLYWELNNLI